MVCTVDADIELDMMIISLCMFCIGTTLVILIDRRCSYRCHWLLPAWLV